MSYIPSFTLSSGPPVQRPGEPDDEFQKRVAAYQVQIKNAPETADKPKPGKEGVSFSLPAQEKEFLEYMKAHPETKWRMESNNEMALKAGLNYMQNLSPQLSTGTPGKPINLLDNIVSANIKDGNRVLFGEALKDFIKTLNVAPTPLQGALQPPAPDTESGPTHKRKDWPPKPSPYK